MFLTVEDEVAQLSRWLREFAVIVRNCAVVYKPLYNTGPYRWELRILNPLTWIGNVEFAGQEILEIQPWPERHRRAFLLSKFREGLAQGLRRALPASRLDD
jgi:hypothetical protein